MGFDEKELPYRAVLSRISQSKNRADGPDDLFKAAKTRVDEQIAVVFQEYEKALRNANALDFDDLLLETVRLLRHDAATRETWNRRLGYLMIDEYQDTNRPQYQLMRLLTTEHDNVCVVGDEDQSIYSWRGADINNILDFEKDYRNAKVIRLEQNYRSTKNILEAASAVVANNTQRKGKWLWTDSGPGDLLTLYPASDGENEALFIADSIEKILATQSRMARRHSVSDQLPVAADRRGAAALRAQVFGCGRLQLLSARRSQGHHRVSEAGAAARRLGEPAARDQHAGSRASAGRPWSRSINTPVRTISAAGTRSSA